MSIESRFSAFCGVLLVLMSLSSLALAARGELDAPALTMARDYPAADYEKVRAVLEGKDGKFLGGSWLNKHTSLRYGGDTIALNKFIDALSRCPGVTVHVNFYRPGGGTGDCDWMVTQMAPSNELVVRINLASENVQMEKLYLPPVKAERTPD